MDLELRGLAMPLPWNDLRHLRAAEGYAELGMYLEAEGEIHQISPAFQMTARVLALRLCIYAGQEKWEVMQLVAKQLAESNPHDMQWTIWWAYAAGRTQSIHAARSILIDALQIHPDNPGVHYSLGCYESRLQHFNLAKRHLARAIQLDSRLKRIALTDEDLEPLWAEIKRLQS
jgi:tetratricopeptide (TPR) repeat protein